MKQLDQELRLLRITLDSKIIKHKIALTLISL